MHISAIRLTDSTDSVFAARIAPKTKLVHHYISLLKLNFIYKMFFSGYIETMCKQTRFLLPILTTVNWSTLNVAAHKSQATQSLLCSIVYKDGKVILSENKVKFTKALQSLFQIFLSCCSHSL